MHHENVPLYRHCKLPPTTHHPTSSVFMDTGGDVVLFHKMGKICGYWKNFCKTIFQYFFHSLIHLTNIYRATIMGAGVLLGIKIDETISAKPGSTQADTHLATPSFPKEIHTTHHKGPSCASVTSKERDIRPLSICPQMVLTVSPWRKAINHSLYISKFL